VSGEHVILRKEEYQRLINALQRAVELAERYAELAKKAHKAVAHEKRQSQASARATKQRVVRLAKGAATELETALSYLYSGDGEWATDHVQQALELIYEILNTAEVVEA